MSDVRNRRGPFMRRQGKHSSSILVMDGAPFPKVAVAQIASLSLIVVSFLGLVTAFIFYVVHPDDTKEVLLVPLVTLVSAGLAGLVATSSVIEWREQRRRDREASQYRHRELVYEQITQFMVQRFLTTATIDLERDAVLRSSAALWGSSDVVETLAQWQAAISSARDSAGAHTRNDGGVPLNAHQGQELKQRLGSAISAMRSDLSPEASQIVPIDSIINSIFNK
jgi:hypothetical protein